MSLGKDMGPFPLDDLLASVGRGQAPVDVALAPGGVRAYLLALVARATGRTVVAVTPTQDDADGLADGLELFLGA